jgi:hypothetical protein
MKTQLDLLDREWCRRMTPVVLGKMHGREFTSDDLHAVVEPPDNKNLFGVLVAKMRCAGLIQSVGFKASDRPERNGGVVRIWRLK